MLRYVEEYQTKTEAMQAEYRFKQLSRGAKERIVQMGGTDNEGPKKL